jgi:hypothetical protein
MGETNKNTNSKFNFVSLVEEDKIVEDNIVNNKDKRAEIEKNEKLISEEYDSSINENIVEKEAPTKVFTGDVSNDLDDVNRKHKFYFSFEARVATSIVVILVFFAVACFLILDATSFFKNDVVKYDEVSTSTYQVNYLQNNIYNNTLGEDMQYVAALIGTIDTSFNYKVNFSEDINYNLSYYVQGTTKIYDKSDSTKILYQNTDDLVSNTSISDFSDNIMISTDATINYTELNNFVTTYKNSYGVNADAFYEITLYVVDDEEVRGLSTISIPMGVQTLSIAKNNISNLNKSVEIDNNVWTEYNITCAVVAIILILIALGLLIRTTRFVLKVVASKNKYESRLYQILRDYDRIIVIARDGYSSNVSKKIIKVHDFNELLDARDTLNKPIIYSKVNNVKSDFIVEDDDTLFKYTLKEADL